MKETKRTKRIPSTRASRQTRTALLKKGKCIELLRPITQCTPAELGLADVDMPCELHEINALTVGDLCERLNIEVSDLMFKLVSHTEGIRNLPEVKDVMLEGDIFNGVFPVRFVCPVDHPMIERVVTKVIAFK